MHQGQGHYAIPDNDWARYLVGCWKRNLEYREFGGSFSHIRTTNAVIVIEQGYINVRVIQPVGVVEWYCY